LGLPAHGSYAADVQQFPGGAVVITGPKLRPRLTGLFCGLLKKSGAQVALTEPGSSLDRYFKRVSGWRLEKQTVAASFYRKSDG